MEINDIDEVLQRIRSRQAHIAIIGLGYVGLPLALRFSEAGFNVLGIDVDDKKVDAIDNGISYIKHLGSDAVRKAKEQGLKATTDFSLVTEIDVLIICVPTPLNKYREPDLSFVINTVDALLPYLHQGQMLSLESTTYPGTTEEELKPRIESTGLVVGEDVYLVYSPEREDPGNPNFSTQTIPKIVGGHTKNCLEVGVALYKQVIDEVVPLSSTKAAEMTKLLENIHRAVNIGLVNEMKIIADKMDVDIYEVIRAAATKPFGFVPYYPGPGLGGHCIPIDPFYLTWKAREYGLHTRFIELAGEINSHMPEWVVEKISEALNEREKSIKGSKILVLGISYKKNIDDMRESPAVELMDILQRKGAVISYSDPWVPVFPKMREYTFNLSSVELSPEQVALYDLVLVATNHDDFDYDMIKDNAMLIVDTRGVFLEHADNIVKA